MPLRDVKPLSEDQWLMLMRCMKSNEPEFIELRKQQSKMVNEALERVKKIK